MNGNKQVQEWLRQAEYDVSTAEDMYKTKRYIYCVFMCHLAIEKALKASYIRELKDVPPKTHDLNFLCAKIGLALPAEMRVFLEELNDLSVPIRYPDELKRVLKEYGKKKVGILLGKSKELFTWVKKGRKS